MRSKEMAYPNGRGFAALTVEQQREVAGKGGRAAHEKGTARKFDSESAREAAAKRWEKKGKTVADEK